MKRFVTYLVLFVAFCAPVNAQYFVYETNGESLVNKGKGWKPVYRTMGIGLADSLRTSQYSCLIILDRGKNALYAFQNSSPATLKDLISSHKGSSRNLVEEAAQELFNMAFEVNKKSMDAYNYTSGVVYRDHDTDLIVAQALAASPKGASDISFRLLDFFTEKPLTEGRIGESAVIEVTNNTGKALYFNIANFNSQGQSSPILPADDHQNMLHLFLPAYSVVRLYYYPIEFSEPCGTDRLVLVAYPQPFNLMNALQLLPTVSGVYSSDVRFSYKSILIK